MCQVLYTKIYLTWDNTRLSCKKLNEFITIKMNEKIYLKKHRRDLTDKIEMMLKRNY